MKMRGIAVLAASAALATGLVAGAGAAGSSVPTGGNLAYAGIDPNDGMSDIFVRLVGGTAATNITHDTGVRKDLSPAFSPNGSKIAFVRANNTGGASIMVVNADGSGLVNVTPTAFRGAVNTDPRWSSDASRIVFASNVDGNFDLYWVELITTSTRALQVHSLTKTAAPVQNLDPAWSPSGKSVVFSRSGHRPSLSNRAAELFQLDVASLQAARLTKTISGRGDVAPVYAPNGLSIGFSSDRTGNDEVYVLNLGLTKTLTQLTNNPARDVEPAFAPDGTAIVFVSNRSKATELFAQNLAGLTPGPAQPVQLTFDGMTKPHPSWGATTTHPGPVGLPVETPLPKPATTGTASPAAS
jgi:Tol biopolymer transport system component